MSDQKKNQQHKRPSLLAFLKSEEARPYIIIIAAGILIALFASLFIKNTTWSLVISLIGAVISITGTESLSKRVPRA